jgi:type II secretory pathway pseudopilin PulG
MGPRRRVPFVGNRPLPTNEAGFTIIECTIALGLVFVVLMGLLGALTAGSRGLITGRQRSAGLALANEVLEDARGRAYGDVGHDLDSDPTLAADPLITGIGANRMYTGVSPAEPLAASAVDAGAAGGTVNNPLYPFSPHIFTSKREQTTYTTSVYVTIVTPASGDPYKRVTVKVGWAPAQYAVAKSVTLSSFLFNAVAPPDPRLTGNGEADSGTFKVSGTLTGISLADLNIAFPYVNGSIDSGFVRSAKGTARSGTAQVDLVAGLLSGCTAVGALGASCDGAKADADSDNDSGTAPPDTDQEGPVSAPAASVGVAPILNVSLGSGTAQAQATARSCWSCQAGGTLPVGDDDRLPYFAGVATGPASLSLGVLTGALNGSLLSIGTGCAVNCAAVTVDRDDVGANQQITSKASVSFPTVGLLSLLGGPAGGAVQVSALSASATAAAGPGAGAPSVSGGAVTVKYWNGFSFVSLAAVTPGTAASLTIPSTPFLAGLLPVTISGTVTANKAVTSQDSAGGAVTAESASLTNWLFVDLNVSVAGLATLNLHLDYGRIAASAGYQPAT